MGDGQERAHGNAGQEHGGGLGLVLEPQLMRFGTTVHAGQGAEHGVDDEVRPANRKKHKGRHGDAQCDADGSQVIVACRWNGMKRTGMGND